MKTKFTFFCLLLGSLLNTHSQTLNWAKRLGGPGNPEEAKSIAVDASGNVYTAGVFAVNTTNDFDPGSGTFVLPNAGSEDVFISKLDASGNFVWAKNIGGTSDERCTGITIDGSGNILITGYFLGTVDFDPGAGTNTITSAGANDIFVCKLDPNGNLIWAKSMGSSNFFGDQAFAIASDASGNVYTTGFFSGTTDFDPGAGTYTLSASIYDAFVSKLDASGNFVWAKKIGGSSIEQGYSIAVDAAGNVCTIGNFVLTVDFDPGAGTFNMTSNGSNDDIFISKLDASGNFVWAKQFSGTQVDYGYALALDATGNVYATGAFQGTVDFDPSPASFSLTSSGAGDVFVTKLDAAGNFTWAKKMGGTVGDLGYDITLDGAGNIYTTGTFNSVADYDPGAGVFNLTPVAGQDIFVSALDNNGNFISAVSMGGTTTESGYSIVVDGSANIYVTGTFGSTIDCDPGSGTTNLTSAGGYDIFVVKLNNVASGINESSEVLNSILIYPNPSNGKFILKLKEEWNDGELIVTDAMGREIVKQELKSGTQETELILNTKGLYFVRLESEEKRIVKKVVVQ